MENQALQTLAGNLNANEPEIDTVEATEQLEGDEQLNQANESEQDAGNKMDEPFPKKAVDVIRRHKKEAMKLKARMREQEESFNRKLQELEQKLTGKSKSDEPVIDDFNDWESYTKAQAEYAAKKHIAEMMKQQDEQRSGNAAQQQKMQELQVKVNNIDTEIKKLSVQYPDIEEVLEVFDDVELTQEQAEILLSIENNVLAAYNLAKSGRLETVLSAPPYIMAAEFLNAGRAQPQKRVSSAPTPAPAAKSSGWGQKPINQLKGMEALKALQQFKGE